MRPFAYARAKTIDEALAAVAEPETAVLAGGTELLNWMRLGLAGPDRVVDISRAGGLDQMQSLPGGGLRIGAAVRLNDVVANPRVGSDWPVLREAVHKAASAQLRNLATIGGNVLQKTRCAYFRSEEQVPCNRRELGSGCGARQGRSDRHALFGWTEDCVATHPADPAVALAALDAEVLTRRRRPGIWLARASQRAGARRSLARRAGHGRLRDGLFRYPSDAQVRLRADGTARIESGFQDIGTGTLTIFPQIVGDVLGLAWSGELRDGRHGPA